MALASAQSCSNVTQLYHLQQHRQQLPRRSQWPGKQQTLLGVPKLGIFLSGQASFMNSLLICCWLETILILPLPLPFLTTPSPFFLSVQHSYRCTLWSCRLTHITQDCFTLHTQPCPTSNTPKTVSFEPLEHFGQIHWGWIHVAAPAPLILGPQF